MSEELQDIIASIRSQEQALTELYERIERAASNPTARLLAGQMVRAQRFQVSALEILEEDRVPERFHCFGSVTHDDVNVRSGPSAQETKINSLQQGVPVIVKEFAGNWAHLQLPDGSSGWVFKDYVRCEH